MGQRTHFLGEKSQKKRQTTYVNGSIEFVNHIRLFQNESGTTNSIKIGIVRLFRRFINKKGRVNLDVSIMDLVSEDLKEKCSQNCPHLFNQTLR